jgi:hypothetical protein
LYLPSMEIRELATKLAAGQRSLDATLAGLLPDSSETSPEKDHEAEWILTVLDRHSEGRRILPFVVDLMHHPSARVRSKAALLIGKRIRSFAWARRHVSDRDARCRANVVEAVWGVDLPGAKEFFESALRDTNNRVVGNAIYGLYALRDGSAIPRVVELAASDDERLQITAIWLMGKIRDPAFEPVLTKMHRQGNERIQRAALRALLGMRSTNGGSGGGAEPKAQPA